MPWEYKHRRGWLYIENEAQLSNQFESNDYYKIYLMISFEAELKSYWENF